MHHLSFALAFLLSSLAFSDTDAQLNLASNLAQRYQAQHKQVLVRYLELESKADGLTDSFRKLLGDRTSGIEIKFQGVGKALPDPILLQAVITERKRLESELSQIKEWTSNPYQAKQNLAQLAGALLRLDTSEILLSYAEFLDEFNRDVRQLPHAAVKLEKADKLSPETLWEVRKLSAATLVALLYTKERKKLLAFSEAHILALVPEESSKTLAMLEAGIGKMDEDCLLPVRDTASKKDKSQQEIQRLNGTKRTLQFLDQIAGAFVIANKVFFDDYNYHLIKLKQKLDTFKKPGTKS